MSQILSWPKLREYVLARDHGGCAYCCDDANTVDHIIPRSKGGTNQLNNLVAACASCNSSKGANTPYDWTRKSGILLTPWWYKDQRP